MCLSGFGQELVWRRFGGNMIKCLSGFGQELVWKRLGGNMIMCLSGVWTGVGEKDGWGYDYVFIWCLDKSWCREGWEGI